MLQNETYPVDIIDDLDAGLIVRTFLAMAMRAARPGTKQDADPTCSFASGAFYSRPGKKLRQLLAIADHPTSTTFRLSS